MLMLLVLFLCALAPRALARRDFVTVDEAYHWFSRVETFLTAVQQGDYAATDIIGHPGVTTMWLGSLGRLAHTALVERGYIPHADSDPFLYWAFLRFPVAFTTSLSVALGWLLLRRLFEKRVALLAALLWATDPFLVAHSQLLHLDALATSFMILALLAALAAFAPATPATSHPTVRWSLLLCSAVAGGLALLTKSPSVAIVPIVGLIPLVWVVRQWPKARTAWKTGALALLVWGVGVAVVWVALWPLAWVDLRTAIYHVFVQVKYEGASPHGWGNFFLGQAVADPGPLFYPVVLVLRMTPWTMIGLVAAGFLIGKRSQDGEKNAFPSPGLLILFALCFTLALSILPKKFDRYILPTFPVLNLVAASGIVGIVDRVVGWLRTRTSLAFTAKQGILLWLLILAGLAFNLAWYHPYELAYYNPLVGGGRTAVQAIPVGWGEGYEQAGAFISAQPDGCDRAVASWFAPVMEKFLCNHWVVSMDRVFEPGKVSYAVLYRDQLQRQNKPEATAYLLNNFPFARVHTVEIHGIEYAYVYQLPLPNSHRMLTNFGSSIQLVGYDVDTTAVHSSGVLTLTLQWMPLEPIGEDYAMFVHIFDTQGNRVGQIDVPPGGPRAPTSAWKLHSYRTWFHPVPIPADLPGGRYWIVMGLYRTGDFARLPVRGTPYPDAPDDGENSLVLEPFVLPER